MNPIQKMARAERQSLEADALKKESERVSSEALQEFLEFAKENYNLEDQNFYYNLDSQGLRLDHIIYDENGDVVYTKQWGAQHYYVDNTCILIKYSGDILVKSTSLMEFSPKVLFTVSILGQYIKDEINELLL